MSRIYLASSWKNAHFDDVLAVLRTHGHDVYDFKHPRPGEDGFHWSECGVDSSGDTAENYLAGSLHPLAQYGFALDYTAMQNAELCVLVLPCGRSAHLEAGWFLGQGRPVFFLLDEDPVTPELMYLMAGWGNIVPGVATLVQKLAQYAAGRAS